MLTLRIDYAYDAFDQLIRRGTDNDGPGGYAPQNKFYAYEDGQIVLGFEYSGMLTSRFLWGPQTDQLLVHESGIFNGAGTPYFPLADQQNTIHDAAQYNSSTGTSAVVIHRYGDAYSSGGSWSNFDGSSYDGGSFAYTGRFTDIYMTGLQWNLHRWYDPYTGRWMSEDPIGFAGGDTNLSRYVFNNPVSLTDPSGLAAAGNETGWDHAVNCMAGFSDIATLGIAPGIRWLFGYDPGIDRSSGWYWGGAAAPVVVATGGAATLPSGIGAAGATTTVFGTTPLFGAGALAAGGAALSRPDVQQLINSSGDRVTTVFTRLSQSPAANRILHTSPNVNLCNALPNSQATQLYAGRIPSDLFQRLLLDGHIKQQMVSMGNVTDRAYVMSPQAMQILQPYFQQTGGGGVP